MCTRPYNEVLRPLSVCVYLSEITHFVHWLLRTVSKTVLRLLL
jgi:hypothetical protein